MPRSPIRAFLLAICMLLLAAIPVAAQEDSPGWLLSSQNDDFIVAADQDVTVGPTETVDALVVLSGSATIEGSVKSLFAVDTDVTVSGASAEVERIFTIDGSLSVDPSASVTDVIYSGTELDETALAAVASGEVTNAQEELTGALAALVAVLVVLFFFVLIGGFIAALALTLLVIAFGTEQVRRSASVISNDVLKTIVVGLLMLIVPSIVFGLLMVTIVGIPLALALIFLWALVVFLGQVVVATWIGERILPRGRRATRPYGSAFLGMLILLLLSWTGIVPLLAGIFGTGAVTIAGWRVLRSGGTPPMPPVYGQPYGGWTQYAPPTYAPPPYAPPPPPPPGYPPQGGQPPASWPQG
jgi:MFS family permease